MHTVKEYLQLKKISPNEVANKAGVDPSYLSGILNHKKFPSKSIAEKLGEAASLPPEVFIFPERWRLYHYTVGDEQRVMFIPIRSFYSEGL